MAKRISTDTKMSFEKFKLTFGPILNMADSPKKDQFLVTEWKRNMKEIAEKEELLAKQKLDVENDIKAIEEKANIRGVDEEQE